jgi:hypothetical protein
MKQLFVTISLFFLIACEKENEVKNTLFYKGQLQCSGDNWVRGNTDEETLKNMTNYLALKGVMVEKAELTLPPPGVVYCAACTCASGRIYVIRVISGSEEILKQEGFYK